MQKNNKIIVVILLCVLGIFILMKWRTTPRADSRASVDKPVPAVRTLEDSGASVEAIPTPAAPTLQNTSACKDPSAAEMQLSRAVVLPEEKITKFMRGQRDLTLLSDNTGCFEIGKSYLVQGAYFDPKFKFAYRWGTQAHVKVLKIVVVPGSQLSPTEPNAADNLIALPRLSELRNLDFYKMDVQLVEDPRTLIFNRSYALPMNHPVAKVISAAELGTYISRGATILDVRGYGKAFPLANSQAMPFRASFNLFGARAISAVEMLDVGIENLISSMPTKKDQEYVIVGYSPLEYSAYNLATYLFSIGFTKLAWLRGGVEEIQSIPGLPPESFPDLSVLNGMQVVEKLQQQAATGAKVLLVDARPAQDFSVESIVGAVNFEIRQKRTADGYYVFRKYVFSAQEIEAAGDEFDKRRLQELVASGRELIVFGDHDGDWRALKVAVLAKAAGAKVSWFRTGFAEWKRGWEFYPTFFRTGRAGRSI